MVSKEYNKSGDYYEYWILYMHNTSFIVFNIKHYICAIKRKRCKLCFWL